MNLRVSTKNNAADPEKGFLIKSILKLCGRTRAMPTAWELILPQNEHKLVVIKIFVRKYFVSFYNCLF